MRVKANGLLSVNRKGTDMKNGFKAFHTDRPVVLVNSDGLVVGNYRNEESAARAIRRMVNGK